MIPIKTTAPTDGTPVLVYVIIAASTLVFLWQQTLPPRETLVLLAEYALVPRRFDDPQWAIRYGMDPNDYLPLLSMAFLHGGWFHLIFNMWTLWLFGRAVEARMGALRFGLLYLVCALLASGAHLAAHGDSTVPTLGASGAIAGVLGAHATLYPRSQVVIIVPIWIVPFFFRVSALLFVGIWFALQVVQGTTAMLSPAVGGGIAWWAHIGGFLAGLVFIQVLVPPRHGPHTT